MKTTLTHKYECWFERNAIGEEYEDVGRPEAAIRAYEANLEEGAVTMFSYERLAALYKQRSDEWNEKRVLKKAIVILQKLALKKRLSSYQQNLLSTFELRMSDLVGGTNGYLEVLNVWDKRPMPY